MRAKRVRAGSAAVMVFAGLLLAGCPAQVYYTGLLAPPRPLAPRRPEEVELFVVTPPARPHSDIGLYQITGGIDANDSTAMIKRLRTEAAARGCEAILITSIDNQASKYTAPNVQASCIVYNQPAALAPPVPTTPTPTVPCASTPVVGLPIGKP
jgi:hypothetical protein